MSISGTSIAVGYLGRISDLRAFYWNIDGRLRDLRALVTDRPDRFTGVLGLGAEWALFPLSGTLLQTSLGLRGAYQASAEDRIGFDPCEEAATDSDSRLCSQPLIQVPINLTLLERIRFSVTSEFYPMGQSWGHGVFDLELGLGAEFF